MFCSRLSALISVLCDIFTVELATTVPLPPAEATVDFAGPGTINIAFPDFWDDCSSVFPSVEGRAAEKAPPLPQPVDGELFVSVADGLVNVSRLFPTNGSDLDLERSVGVADEPADMDDRLLRFLARLARPTSPRPGSEVSLTTVG